MPTLINNFQLNSYKVSFIILNNLLIMNTQSLKYKLFKKWRGKPGKTIKLH